MDQMSEIADMPGMEEPSSGMGAEVCVPIESVMQEGDASEGVAPEIGDTVTVQLSGKVSRVEGSNVYFQAESANGEPMTAAEDVREDSMESMDDEFGGENY